MIYFLQQALNAIQHGSIYALVAVGYSLVYGTLRLFNFSHGDVFMTGAFIALWSTVTLHCGFWLSLIAAMLGSGLIAVLIEQIAYKPLRNAPRVSLLITALACGLVLEHVVLLDNPYPQYVPTLIHNIIWNLGGLTITSLQVMIIAITFTIVILLDIASRYTLLGIAQRAIATDPKTLILIGIPLDRVITTTFAISGALAGIAGILYTQAYPVINPYMGVSLGWKAFICAVIGGIGNLRGAILGGFILGAVEVFTVAFFPSTYRDFAAFSLLVLFLILRPQGLLGKTLVEKV